MRWLRSGMPAFLLISVACAPTESTRRAVPDYDTFTGRLVRLSADQNGDGRLDQWTYLDGNRPLRGEADTDGDGRIDRWEYFDANAQLVRVGSSSRNDGVEDTWTLVQPRGGTSEIDRSRNRDRHVDRREFFMANALLRAEEDANGDGLTDRWERYDRGTLREVAFDTSFAAGRADRRVLYDEQGRFVAVEVDVERNGAFVRLTGTKGVR